MTKRKNKIIFVIQPDHGLDLITNSSSELFVLKGETTEMVKEMLEATFPGYTSEYEEVVNIDDLDDDSFEAYLSYAHDSWSFNQDIEGKIKLARTFNIDPNILYSNYKEVSNEVRQSGMMGETWYPEYSEEGLTLLKNKIDPERKMYFLHSLGENPNWENQEKLESIATRYHLG